MGAVYRALDRLEGVPVAVKVMSPGPGDAAERFAREGLALATLDHPAIVRYVAHGKTPDARPWLAMEWLEGEDLAERLQRTGLAIPDAVELVRRAAAALGEAHRRGIVHRDLKPSNLFLVDGDPARVKILDFGVARMGFASMQLTRPGQVVGTPAYMAPEQARGELSVTPAADVWSLGAVLFECVAGRPPFVGEMAVAVLAKVILEEAPLLGDVAEETPAALEALVDRMLEREPSARPAGGHEVAEALADLSPETPAVAPRRSMLPVAAAITGAEQELIAIVLAVLPDVELAATVMPDATLVDAPVDPRELGADVQRLADGSTMAVLRGAGQAVDLATRAARTALALAASLGPPHRVAAALGRAQLRERLPAGEVVDRAAALAARGGAAIRLDELTSGLLPARFVTRPIDGGAELIEERDEDDPARTLLGRPTPLVGRRKELRMLQAVADATIEESSAQAALLVGPAGAGKSRLRHELVRVLREDEPDVEVWIGRGDPVSSGSPFGLVRGAIAGALALREGDPLESRRERIRARVARVVPEAERTRVTEFLGELLGARFDDAASAPLRAARSDPQLMGDQLRRAVLDLLAAETRAHPLLLVLEDLQWGDLPSVRLVESAIARLEEQPFMVLAAARPEVEDRFVDLFREGGVEQLHLSPLSRRASERLAREVLGEDADGDVIARIVERSQGNAFFLEELLRAEAEGRGGELPATLVAVAQARLDALEPDARRILRASSVCGLALWPDCVRAILGGADRTPQLDSWLDTLVRGEVLERRARSRFAGQVEHAFLQEVMREAAYESLTEGDRAVAHRLAAVWLEAAGERDAVRVAEHFERGGEAARAAGWWARAAEQALEANDLDAALARVERGLSRAEGQLLGRLHLVRSEALAWRLDYEDALAASAEARERLEVGSAGWFEAASVGVSCAKAMGRHDEAAAVVDALREAPADAAPVNAARALATAASHLLYAGDPEGAEALRAALGAVARLRSDEPAVLGEIELLAARFAAFAGDTGEYAVRADEARRLFEAAGDVRRTLNQHSNYGYALLELGRIEDAEREIRAALHAAREARLTKVVAFAHHNLGLALGLLGRLDDAVEHETRAIEELREAGHRRLEAGSRIYLALILRLAGDLDAALAEARAAEEQLREVAPPLRPFALATAAAIHLDRGEPDEALRLATEAREAGGAQIEAGESLVRLVYAEALRATGDEAGARDAIREAEARLRERAAKIQDPAYRESFLTGVPENARTIELAASRG